MAAEVKYRITSTDDTKAGTNSAVSNLEKLGGAAKSLGNILKAVGIGFSIGAVVKGVSESIKAFGEQEKTELRLIAAAKNNPYINGKAVNSLKQTALAMSKVTIFSDEAIIQQQAFLATLGMGEAQINNIMDAATNLASTGMISLEGAVKNISKTYAGMTGELGELLPQLKTLTAEQLKAGAAVDVIKKGYAGMAEAAASGVAGSMEIFKNNFNSLKESIGGILGTLASAAATAMAPIIKKMTGWLDEHRDQVVAFFVRFPEVAAAAFATAGNMIRKVFSLEFIANAAKSVFEFLLKLWKTTLDLMWQLLKSVAITLWEPLRYAFEWIGGRIKFAWQTVVNALITTLNAISTPIEWMINQILTGINKVLEAGQKIGLFKNAKQIEMLTLKIDQKTIDEIKEPIPIDTKKMGEEWNKTLGMVPTALKDTFVNAIDLLGDVLGPLAPELEGLKKAITDIVNRPLEPQYQAATDKAAPMADEKPAPVSTGGSSGGGFNFDLGIFGDILGVIANVANAFGPLIGMVMQLSSVMQLMNPMQTILTAMMKVLEPVINNLLTPMVGILNIIGKTLGAILMPLLEMLGPIIKVLGDIFVWFFNKVIRPVANFLIAIGNAISNAIAAVFNFISDVVRVLSLGTVKMGHMTYRDLTTGQIAEITPGDLTAAGAETTTSGGGGSTAAQYTEAPDVYITVNVFNGVGVMTDRTMTIEELSILISDTTESLIAKGTV